MYEQAPTSEVVFALPEEPFEQPISARSLSDGTLRFAALAMALLGQAEPALYVVEELENGLNPTRLQLLLSMMVRAVDGNPDLQVIGTTHSAQLLDYLSDELRANVLVLGWNREGDHSQVTRLTALPGYAMTVEESSLSDLLNEGWIQMAASD